MIWDEFAEVFAPFNLSYRNPFGDEEIKNLFEYVRPMAPCTFSQKLDEIQAAVNRTPTLGELKGRLADTVLRARAGERRKAMAGEDLCRYCLNTGVIEAEEIKTGTRFAFACGECSRRIIGNLNQIYRPWTEANLGERFVPTHFLLMKGRKNVSCETSQSVDNCCLQEEKTI